MTGTALLAAVTGVACGDSAPGSGEVLDSVPPRAVPEAPTYAKDVAPIFFERCAPCHRPEGPGPFTIADYDAALDYAPRIAQVTEERYMPPWLPTPGVGGLADERWLSAVEIATIGRWVEQGAVFGDSADLPPLPEFPSGWALGPPDLVVEMPEPYELSPDLVEEFRNFVIPVPIEEDIWIRGIEMRPTNPRVVHHAKLMEDPSGGARRLDSRDPAPGYDGMISEGEAQNPGGFMFGWTPGKAPSLIGGGLAWHLRAGTDLVLQLHMRSQSDRPELAGATVAMYLAEEPPSRTPFIVRLGDRTLDIAPGETDYGFEDEYTLPVDVELMSVYPHAHYLGKTIEAQVTLPDGAERWLLRIDDWNFNWQDLYRYEEPVHLPRGSVLRTRFTYDNSAGNPLNPSDPPRRVVYGPSSLDEMAELWLQVVPRTQEDLSVLIRDYAEKDRRDRIAGWVKALEIAPEDAGPYHALMHNNLGRVLRSRGRMEEAANQFRAALLIVPDDTEAHFNLGLTYGLQGRFRESLAEHREAARLDREWAAPAAAAAWIMATNPDLFRPDEAVRLAVRAAELTGYEESAELDVLAAAYAASGEYDLAATTQVRAVELAAAEGRDAFERAYRERLGLYLEGRPYLEPAP